MTRALTPLDLLKQIKELEIPIRQVAWEYSSLYSRKLLMRQKKQAESKKPQILREAMLEALKCCEVWGVVAVVKQSDTTITLDSEAFVDVLHPRQPGDGFEQEVILITSEELQDAYHKTFRKISDPTEPEIE